MKVNLVFHADTCCRFDCLVRYCTCGAEPEVVEVSTELADTVRQASGFVGDEVEILQYWEQTADGVLLEFATSRSERL